MILKENHMDYSEIKNQIDRFVGETKKLLGKEINERPQWNSQASGDAIRHFASGIGEDNPLYVDPAYGNKGPYGRQTAPPGFLTSVLYPMSHGASLAAPLWFLAAEVAYEWFSPIIAGDKLRAISKIIDVYDIGGSAETRRAYIGTETCYLNQDGQLIGKCIGTTACVPKSTDNLLQERSVYKYSDEEIKEISTIINNESRFGNQRHDIDHLIVGQEMPVFVRGPLTIGDMVCWQTAIGPAQQTGPPGLRKLTRSLNAERNPATGWHVEPSQQFVDFLLASQRGMPLPFDQGVMRFACLSPMITNWIGDNGFLNSLAVKIIAPNLYGDTTWYHGRISERSDAAESIHLKLKITGKNQLGEITTEAEAGVTLPKKDRLTFHLHGEASDDGIYGKKEHRVKWVTDFFEDQAAIRADAVSLVCGETRLTYQEVNHKSSRVAENLLSAGVSGNEKVAICMGRSHSFIIAVLGILKAGAAYVPLDPLYPQKRLIEIIEDCQAKVLIIDGDSSKGFEDFSGKIIPIDYLLTPPGDSVIHNHSREITKEDIAYIMYTSGSVGKSKGVAVSHGNLSSYIFALQRTFDIDDTDVCLHSASFGFSASVRQTFLPLCTGAALVIADNEQRSNPIDLAELICRERVTHWDTVPSIFSLCCETFLELKPADKRRLVDNNLRCVMITGEPLAWDVCHIWNQDLKHNAKIVNLYSQTETTGTVCSYEVPMESLSVSGLVPIGRPLPETTLYILGEDGQPVSYGESGEICVTGPRITQGYLKQPELTTRHFMPNPFDAETAVRIYKTGDIGCYLPDGNILTKGRKDRRFKIRGFRIELEEVERALKAHHEITQAVVVTSNLFEYEGRLLAYCVFKGKTGPQKADLRSFLQRTLPDYMLPALYIFLDEIPFGPNGKVDYQALPAPDFTRLESDNAFIAPRTSIETTIAGIWTDVLKIDQVGTHDNFFELGGHSLLAARILAKIRNEFEIDLTMQNFFNAPTISGLSLFITRDQTKETISVGLSKIIDELENMTEEEVEKLLDKEMKSSDSAKI